MASNDQYQESSLTVGQLLDRPAQGLARKPSSDKLKGVESSLQGRLDSLKLTNPPETPAKVNQEEIKEILVPLKHKGLVVPIGGLPKDGLDPRVASKKQKSLANFSTNLMVFNNYGKDGQSFNILKGVDIDKVTDKSEAEAYVAALENSLQFVGSSGTMQGVLNRLVSGMTEAPRVKLDVNKCVAWARAMVRYQEVDHVYVGTSLADQLRASQDLLRFNMNSNAGVPYYGKISDPGVFQNAVQVGTELLNSIAQGTFAEYVSSRKALVAVCLKNKQDIYESDKLESKIRPYYVYGLHERLLYSTLQCRLKPVLFTDEQTLSGSAVGFSWNYGGGDALYAWVEKRAGQPGFHSLFYGDDQLWVLATPFGSYVVTPDFSHMDLSLCSDWGQVCYQVWRPCFKSLDQTWDAVLRLNCLRGFTCSVLIDGALTYQFKHGWKSGIPGTTKGDEVASAAINGFIKEDFENALPSFTNQEDVRDWLNGVITKVRTTFGMIFKPSSMKMYTFYPDQSEYEFVFLGQTLVHAAGAARMHYVPKPSLEKLIISATTHKKQYKSAALRDSATKNKIRSLFAGGGHLFPILRSRLEAIFHTMDKKGVRCLMEDGDGDEYLENTDASRFFDDHTKLLEDSWPTHEWVLNLYLPPDDQLPEVSGLTQDELMSEISGSRQKQDEDFAAGFDLSVFEATLNPTDWAAQTELEREQADVGNAELQNPPQVPEKFMAQTQPLTQEEKSKFEREQQRKREEERAKKAKLNAGFDQKAKGKGKSKAVQGRRMDKLMGGMDFERFESPDSEDDEDGIYH